MRILLIGDCSGVHSTLAKGLRTLGHTVCVASDGGGWKDYPRDISLTRKDDSFLEGMRCMFRILVNLHKFRNFDVVQITHCPFLRLRSERTLPIYRFLRKYNRKVFMGAFGTDHYYVKASLESNIYRYSDFRVGDKPLDFPYNAEDIEECLHGGTVRANQEIASTCDGIIACLWEYNVAYHPHFPEKTTFIPLPFEVALTDGISMREVPRRVNFFIGVQSDRDQVKGTDVMYPVLKELERNYPDLCKVTKVSDLPFAEYQKEMSQADVLVDQLYSYTPAMNALLAMSKGIVVVGGGEEENYEILGENELRPIINVTPSPEDIYIKLEELLLNKTRIPQLSKQSVEYVRRHHDHVKVGQQYLDFWASR